jgi:formylmethanofuran dehydrogenase subunit E
MTTTNLSDFGYRELAMLRDLIDAMLKQGLPDEFSTDEVTPMMNQNSGNVFLTNSEYEVAMLNGDKLESFYSCVECGNEGFKEDIAWDSEKHVCGECAKNAEEEQP